MTDWLVRVGQILRGHYVRLLEEEVTRERAEIARMREEIAALLAENRALINSLLGTAGVPPIETAAAPPTVLPVRRRSWPQISAAREAAAAQQPSERTARKL